MNDCEPRVWDTTTDNVNDGRFNDSVAEVDAVSDLDVLDVGVDVSVILEVFETEGSGVLVLK